MMNEWPELHYSTDFDSEFLSSDSYKSMGDIVNDNDNVESEFI